MRYRVVPSLLLPLTLLAAAGCDKASPVAPAGSTITLSASPAQVASPNGTSTITAVVLRANGTPVNPGTQVRFSTTLGTIDPVAETDSTGTATATLRGDGRIGTAKVKATTGNVATPPEIDVILGSAAGSITLQATPSTVPETGGRINLLALVRDAQGRPLPGIAVNFSSPVGTLQSGGNFRNTDDNGRATDTLNLNSADLSTLTGDSFVVQVEVAGGTGQLMNDTFTVGVQRPPVADFSFVVNNSTSQVAFKDETTPKPTSWRWEFGDGDTSTQQNPTHTYSAAGTYFVTLTVRNPVGESTITKSVTIGTP
jgi:PKD repeat protein